jgi:uncharacterized protein DUF3551
MRRLHLLLFALTTLAAVAVFTPMVGQAEPYKWCAQYGGANRGGARNCGFVSWEQCMATVSGIGGTCEPNLFYTGPANRQVKGARKPRKRHYD